MNSLHRFPTPDPREFTRARGLDIQQRQLADWKPKLNDIVYTALAAECARQNELSAEDQSGYSVWRGSCMDNFVANWHRASAHKEEPAIPLRAWHAEYSWNGGQGGLIEKQTVVVADNISAATAALLAEFSATNGHGWKLKEISLAIPAVTVIGTLTH